MKFVFSLSLEDFVLFLSILGCGPEKGGQLFGMETKIREFKENSRYLFSQRISSISSFFLIELSREISPIVANW